MQLKANHFVEIDLTIIAKIKSAHTQHFSSAIAKLGNFFYFLFEYSVHFIAIQNNK